MKINLINLTHLKYSLGFEKDGNKLINISYLSKILQFQTPTVVIKEIVKESDKDYLLLELLNTRACKTFYDFVIRLEQTYPGIKSIFNGNTFRVKIPLKKTINIYCDDKLFNYYHLREGMEIICLIEYSKLWVNKVAVYNFNVNEILIKNNIGDK
jgi:hypothetical protein